MGINGKYVHFAAYTFIIGKNNEAVTSISVDNGSVFLINFQAPSGVTKKVLSLMANNDTTCPIR
jgi:hypothetical protein